MSATTSSTGDFRLASAIICAQNLLLQVEALQQNDSRPSALNRTLLSLSWCLKRALDELPHYVTAEGERTLRAVEKKTALMAPFPPSELLRAMLAHA